MPGGPTFLDLVGGARERVLRDALSTDMVEGERLEEGGSGAAAYADAVVTILGLCTSKMGAFHWPNVANVRKYVWHCRYRYGRRRYGKDVGIAVGIAKDSENLTVSENIVTFDPQSK